MTDILKVKIEGEKIESKSGCELYMYGGFAYMISEKSGVHMVANSGISPNKRTLLHWDGFIQNQNR